MLAMYLTHCFFNFMLLDYFLKYSGDKDSKEQLSLAKGGSFSDTPVFSMAYLAKRTRLKKQQEKVHPRRANTIDSIPVYWQSSSGIRLGGMTGSLGAGRKYRCQKAMSRMILVLPREQRASLPDKEAYVQPGGSQ